MTLAVTTVRVWLQGSVFGVFGVLGLALNSASWFQAFRRAHLAGASLPFGRRMSRSGWSRLASQFGVRVAEFRVRGLGV